jgi:hypothetical protein
MFIGRVRQRHTETRWRSGKKKKGRGVRKSEGEELAFEV